MISGILKYYYCPACEYSFGRPKEEPNVEVCPSCGAGADGNKEGYFLDTR